ncbi:MAG: hypothetical protein HY049_00910, partial [Acidobacteria bacterium]|nr:hypothetical protein [Acidobacteriota bacterium]
YVPTPTSCGVGACSATGQTQCVGGIVTSTCTPGTPAPSDATCNNIDDDCDGSVDEDYVPTPTSCGVGACSATGQTQCVGGSVTSTCTPGTPAPSDATCNNVDDDCNGQVDEDYVPTPTSCGVGACSATGPTQCVGGSVTSTCTPGTPAPSDATCNNIDDDCDGAVDEDYVPTPTSCGVGACSATGQTQCVGGSVTSTCTPGTPAPSDATCNNVDDDCDGTVDEDFGAVPTSCGIGTCASTGVATCLGGRIFDTCTQGAPGVETCDGLDNDCNGFVDDGIAPPGQILTALADGDAITWDAVAGATGYDVVRGSLGTLNQSSGNFGTSTEQCVANDTPVNHATFSGIPALGTGYWFLVRAVSCGGNGTYDTPDQSGHRDAEVALSAGACP